MTNKDIEKKRAYSRAYNKKRYQEDPEYKLKHQLYTRANEEKYNSIRKEMLKVFRANGCCLCQEKEECCLQAHHVDPTTKEYKIAELVSGRYGVERLRTELTKCVCVCANCHFKIHASVIAL